MKKTGKLLSLLLVLTIVLSLSVTALAADGSYTITILGDKTTADHTFEAYQVFAGDLYDANENEEGASHSKILSNIVWGDGVDQSKVVNGQTLSQAFDGKSAAVIAEELSNSNSVSAAQAFAKKVAPYLSATYKQSTKDASSGNYLISGLAAGYYLVKDADNTLDDTNDFYTAYLMKVVADVQAAPKGDKPTLKKQVEMTKGEWRTEGSASFQIGSTVTFRLIASVPDVSRYTSYTYKITDTMSEGLTSNVKSVNDIAITVDNQTPLDKSYYSVTTETADGSDFVLTIDIMKAIGDGKIRIGDNLNIVYSAVLNDNAVIYDEKNTNTAHLEYSNNPNGDGTGKTPDTTVDVYSLYANIKKVDSKNTNTVLTGAKFVLSTNPNLKVSDLRCNKNGVPAVTTDLIALRSAGKTADGSADVYAIASAQDSAEDPIYVIEMGSVKLTGFGAETYYLYETKAPNGYNLLSDPVALHFSTEGEKAPDYKASLKIDDKAIPVENMSFTIANSTGATLPETGGIGTTLFYIIGGLLVVGAGVLLVTKKRMGKADN